MLLADSLISGIQSEWVVWTIHWFFEFFISVLAIFLILLVLVQRGRGGGIAGALGGMGGNSAFGTKAGDTFTWITYATAAVWILLAMLTIKTFTDPIKDKAALAATKREEPEDARDVQPIGTSSGDSAESGDMEKKPIGDEGTGEKSTDKASTDKEPAGEKPESTDSGDDSKPEDTSKPEKPSDESK
jgi:preprotein translocase subunit SecG